MYVPTHHPGSVFLELMAALALSALALSAQTVAPVTRSTDTGRTVSVAAGRWSLHREIQTAVPLANRFFDEGLSLHYAYRHGDAVHAFREAQRVDPSCVMCALGEAIALGPTIDAPMSVPAETEAVAAVERARQLLRDGVGGIAEAAWTRAVASRYSTDRTMSRATLDSAFAKSMGALADAYPLDADAQTLAAEAAMILTPYSYWAADMTALPGTRRMVLRLKQAMRAAPGQHGACYFLVHALEAVRPAARCVDPRSARR